MALSLFDETRGLVLALESNLVDYAIAGAIALAIHGAPRATSDIDLLVPTRYLTPAMAVARECGFDLDALPMTFDDGMEIQRMVKLAGAETLILDFIIVNDNLRPVWDQRQRLSSESGEVWVVSRQGLIQMKAWAARDQDLADIRRLEELDR